MDNKTYVVTMGKDSYFSKTFNVSGPEEKASGVYFGRPMSVTEFEGHPKLYTEKDLAKARGEGQFQIGDIIEYEGTKEKRVIVNKNKCGYFVLAKSGHTYILSSRLEGWHKTGKNIDVSYIMDELMED